MPNLWPFSCCRTTSPNMPPSLGVMLATVSPCNASLDFPCNASGFL